MVGQTERKLSLTNTVGYHGLPVPWPFPTCSVGDVVQLTRHHPGPLLGKAVDTADVDGGAVHDRP